MTRLKKNLSMQVLYQIIITITPLITSPYLSRKLGVDALGIYSYTYSIISYFVLICMLGFINYGTRTIASLNSANERKTAFSEIYALQLLCCGISLLLFIIILFFSKDKTIYLILQSFWILSCLFDVTWYFFGKEEFKITIIRNLIIKTLSIILIFILVKNSADLWKYIMIMSLGSLISQFSLWIISLKDIDFKSIRINNVIRHLKPVLILFIPILAMSIYHIMDKTMLGMLSTTAESGYYYNADKIVNIPLGILTGIGTVMLSSITSLISSNKKNQAIILFKKSIRYMLCISVALSFGVAAISNDFIPFFFGKGYESCTVIVKMLSIVIICKSLSDVLRTQYMIPFKQEKYFIIAVIFGSIVNLIFNLIFIYILKMGAIGATFGTVIAELFVCIMQLIFVNKFESIIKNVIKTIPFILIGLTMYFTIQIIAIKVIGINIVIKIILEILTGGIVYLTLCFIYFALTKDEILNYIKEKLFKNKIA